MANVIKILPNKKVKEKYEYNPEIISKIEIVHPDNRILSELMTIFEYTELISIRAKQIENGGICYTVVGSLSDPIDMAKKELHDRKCPLTVKRLVANNIYELWTANELIAPNF